MTGVDLGEWGDVDEPPPDAQHDAEAVTVPVPVLHPAVADAVRREVQTQLTAAVAAPVDAALTPERLAALGEWAEKPAEAEPPADREASSAEADVLPRLYYGSVDEFVRELIVPVFRRNVGGGRGGLQWSAEWWRSAEAIMRLEALWRSWEHLRLDPATGISVWLRDHADHHLAVLLDPQGPFVKSKDEATADQPLPYTPPPPGLFPDVREQP